MPRFLSTALASITMLATIFVPSMLAGCKSAPTAPGFPEGTVRVLFIGNSLTYTNDLPGMFAAVAQQAGRTDVRAAGVAFADFALEDHWAEGTALSSLAKNRWEYVVMQQGSSALAASQSNLRTWSLQFDSKIRAAGATPVMYMVWPTVDRTFDFPAVRESYTNAAFAIDGLFAPAGDAWVAYGNLNALYAADGLHPTTAGTYLAAIVLLERLTGIRVELLPATIPGSAIAPNDVRALQRAARTALDRNPARPRAVPQ
ncbi:hypothetical protein [Gemmatimonas groenlandica]|uniref:SGNH hydrolase-type esterase domain-containing protein n=1 Tax=Gemmatimonas groenlandica TaxID=2732249 RepID=A0A6M4IQ21_9BACT|nr:hypothetical protein [Gemmatimonas groenlandica]QJR36810.1 hypothetical protein HKW67_15435 [Gemmatimonas groenlandica]